MVFGSKEKRAKELEGKTPDELVQEGNHYTRSKWASGTSSAIAVALAGPTHGVSLIPLALSGGVWHRANNKKQQISDLLQEQGVDYQTRNRDRVGGVAIAGTISLATQGVGSGLYDVGNAAGHDTGFWHTMKDDWTAHEAFEEAGQHGFESGLHKIATDIAVPEGEVFKGAVAETLAIPVGSAAESIALTAAKKK